MKPKLSILIPTICGREDSLELLLEELYRQRIALEYPNIVQFFIEKDAKEKSVGEKRNILIERASGEYVSHIDDDDRISNDYIKQLLAGIETSCDVITFNVSVSLNGDTPKICYYSIDFESDYNEPSAYYRLPNHLMCVKTLY